MSALRDITEREWREYEWHEVTALGDTDRVFICGRRLTRRPQEDGYVYVEAFTAGDEEQLWVRAKTFLE